MKNPLLKRPGREIFSDLGKSIALFLFLTLTIGFISGFLVADGSMSAAYDQSFEKYNIEDGHFTLSAEISKQLKDDAEKEDVTVYPLFFKDFTLSNDHTVRVYKLRNDVNRICLMDGKFPSDDNDIIIDRLYAENNGIEIGDSIDFDGKAFKVCGTAAFSDYSALFKNHTDMMFDANKFTVSAVTDKVFDDLDRNKLKYNYAWVNDNRDLSDKEKSELSDKIRDVLTSSGTVTDYIAAIDNQAIIFTGEDMGSDKVMITTLLYIIMVVIAFVFGTTTKNTLEKEAKTVGTLRASGYTRGELIAQYAAAPLLITLISAVIGNILGYTFFKGIVVNMYYHSYSLPTYETLWNGNAFVLTTVIPCLIVLFVVLAVLFHTLRLSPLQFLRKELKQRKKTKVMKLKRKNFISRFRLRVIFQNIPSYLTLFLGVLFAGVLLLFGMMMSPLLSHFKEDVISSEIATYQYVLKAPVEVEDGAEKYAVCSLENEKGEEILVYGIEKNSKYFDKELEDGKALISTGYADKYGVENGDTVTLSEKYDNGSYDFKVSGQYRYPATLSVFMTREDFNKEFDKDENYFTGYFSNEKLDIDENYVAGITTRDDLTVMADQLEDSMGKMFYLFYVFAIVIYILLIYLFTKQITEKNVTSISMLRILGYEAGEISRIYNYTTGIVMLVSLVVSLPVSCLIIKVIYRAMMMDYNGWLTLYFAPWIWPTMLAIGLACYLLVYFFQTKRINKIPLGEALKSDE